MRSEADIAGLLLSPLVDALTLIVIQLVYILIAIAFYAVRLVTVLRNVEQWLASKQRLFFRTLTVLTSCCSPINIGTRTNDQVRQHQGQEGSVEQSPVLWHRSRCTDR